MGILLLRKVELNPKGNGIVGDHGTLTYLYD